MTELHDQAVMNAAQQMVSAKDELIAKAVTATIGPDWTLESLRGRLHYIVQPDKVEVFMLDEKPIIEFRPVEFDYAVELGQTKILYTQNYRIFNEAKEDKPCFQ